MNCSFKRIPCRLHHHFGQGRSENFERSANFPKISCLLACELSSDFFQPTNCSFGVDALTTAQADFGLDRHDCRIVATPQKFFNFLFNKCSATNRTSFKALHSFPLLVRQSIHNLGSGRYTVIRTAHRLFSSCPIGVYRFIEFVLSKNQTTRIRSICHILFDNFA